MRDTNSDVFLLLNTSTVSHLDFQNNDVTEIVYQAIGQAFTKCQLQIPFSKINASSMMQPVRQHANFPREIHH